MTDREFKAQKVRLKKLAAKWVKPIGLDWWTIYFVYSREPLKSTKGEDYAAAAICKADWEYLTATIEFNIPKVAKMTDDDIEDTFVHELSHVFVNEMRMWGTERMEPEKFEEAIKHEERVVSQLTNALIWARQRGFEEGQRASKQKKRH